jgi:hypothetical protein
MGIEQIPRTFVCDISGLSAPGLEDLDGVSESDPMEDSPLGWTQVTILTRVPNPETARVEEAYKQAVAQVTHDLQGENKKRELELALWAVEAKFADFFQIPEYNVETNEIWVHPMHLAELLGRLDPDQFAPEQVPLPLALEPDDPDSEEEDDESDLEEPEEEIPVGPVAEKAKKKAKG